MLFGDTAGNLGHMYPLTSYDVVVRQSEPHECEPVHRGGGGSSGPSTSCEILREFAQQHRISFEIAFRLGMCFAVELKRREETRR